MPVDLWDAATWPSPSPEAEVRARVRARTRALRRRRSLPALAAASALAVAVAVWPRPSAQTGLATEGATEEATAVADDAHHDDGEQGQAAVPTTPAASAGVASAMPPRVDPSEPGAPALPVPTYSSGHPVLRDAVGDGVVETAPARWERDPTVDIVDLDVTADDEAVTVELRLGDLSATPLSSFTRGRPTAHDYEVGLRRDGDYFMITLHRQASGQVSVTAGYWSAHGDLGFVDTSEPTVVEGIIGTVDTAQDTVRLIAPYRALNQAVARHSQVHPGAHQPVGLGTTVRPTGSTTARYQGTYNDAPDRIESTDPTFAYRLGD